MQTKETKVKTVSVVILITLLGKVLGLGRDILLGQSFGTGYTADALMAASLIPRQFFDVIFASAISASFIPILHDVLEKEGKKGALQLSNSFFHVMGLALLCFSVLGVLFAPQIITLTANFDPGTHALATSLLRIIFPSLFFTGIAFSMVGFLQSFGEFRVPAMISACSNGIIIVYLLFFVSDFGVYGAAFAMLIAWGAQAVVQIPAMKKKGFSYEFRFWHPAMKQIGKLMLPVMLSTWAFPINMLILLWFASGISGGASSIGFANGLYLIIAGIFVLSVTNVVFPELSRLWGQGKKEDFSHLIGKTTRTLLFFLLPMTAGLMLLSTPLVRFLYERQEFTAQSTYLTGTALSYLSVGMVGFGLFQLFTRVFYAQKNGKPPIVAGIVSIMSNVLLCYFLVPTMGVSGLGLASGLSILIAAIVLCVPTHRHLVGGLFSKNLFWALLKMSFATGIMAVLVFFLYNTLENVLADNMLGRGLLLLLPAMAGMACYFSLAYVLQLEELDFLRKFFRRGAGA